MSEYIEKAELIKKLCFETAEWSCSPTIKTIKEFPSADVQPVKHGHWDYSEKENGECAWYFCSECDSPAEQLYDDSPLLSEFCPHCGVRMNDDVNIEASIEAQKSREQRRDNVKAIQERNLFETEVEGLYLNFEQDSDTEEDDDSYIDKLFCEYILKCGAKVESGIKTSKRDKPLYTMDEICKINGVEFNPKKDGEAE